MTLVKICGLTSAGDAVAAVAAGADWLGFHFCPSRRRVTPDAVAQIVRELPQRRTLVGVFIDASEDEAASIADYCDLDLLQLHGSEAPGFNASRPVMKALKVSGERLPDARPWPDPILLDSWTPNQQGGSGRTWDWELARPLLESRQVFIAGGLRAETVGGLVSEYRPHGVDVSSGVELEVRRKDPVKMHEFVAAVRRADAGPG